MIDELFTALKEKFDATPRADHVTRSGNTFCMTYGTLRHKMFWRAPNLSYPRHGTAAFRVVDGGWGYDKELQGLGGHSVRTGKEWETDELAEKIHSYFLACAMSS